MLLSGFLFRYFFFFPPPRGAGRCFVTLREGGVNPWACVWLLEKRLRLRLCRSWAVLGLVGAWRNGKLPSCELAWVPVPLTDWEGEVFGKGNNTAGMA